MPEFLIAYCGPAAVPQDLWARWNLDPFVLAGLAALSLAVGAGRSRDARAGWAAIALMFVVFVSPLCALSSALFSARVLHHLILVAAVAPLLARAFPMPRLYAAPMALLVALHAVFLWLWHAPGPYAWGLSTVGGYWLMQATLLGSAWLLWRAVLSPATPRPAALLGLVATVAQMGLLGALIVFARVPLYWVHLASTAPWGMTPITDQELAGLLMWAPAMLPYLAVGLHLAWSGLPAREPAL